ncbi:universal stress protein [Halorubrum ezzemoulense]|jgi:nucleotide-binding universal stress UspA family protein|uniref:Universal stress protein n=1 Tax=Halorubrum ezzemoulense TaxID=337243 RepID=A0A256J312_HALEZ|nr:MULTISPECIES: universal stress protein [Halorubrum]MDB2243732.1 universal stress protein [Halorubrum ezzemoulense]MDB2251798.1 universal stress protein [Halorubrum ezzemoulense]MDB2264075.1 universal stress protein [Halorubrum ezzemoulense]MDB2277468.1 universal stress protein [Halorubrum ezzemoulense]MDB2284178.1 universal stress protein [Halorubrum ezzemoulense]
MRIVFATDLSDANEAAIESRTCLECLDNIGVSEVHLLTVVPDNVSSGLPGMDAASDAREALAPQRSVFERAGFDVETHVARGTPHRRINGLAERLDADMIVVGSRGQAPLQNRLIGGTVRNVARTAVRPLLVERIEETPDGHAVKKEHLFQDVLYATDFSENAARAYDYFPALTGATERAYLLHVGGGDAESTATAEERLDELASDLGDRTGFHVETNVRSGNPVDEITAEEERVGATTTLIGARGTSRLRRLLLGSTAESIVARGTNNVLLVPPEAAAPR